MKVLLDENIPHDLRPHLGHHETFTAAYLGWAGLKNGQLLEAAEKDGFEVMVTGDLSLTYQQNMAARKIAIVSLSAIGWPVIEPHAAKIVEAVDGAKPESFTRRLRRFCQATPSSERPYPQLKHEDHEGQDCPKLFCPRK